MAKSYMDDHYSFNKMTLTGQGQVTVAPNLAIIHLGVLTTGSDLESIQAENAQKSQDIIQALQQIGITDIKTFQYSIDKIYDYENGNQIDRGYSVRNILEIRTSNINQVGSLIDTAVNAGANIVDLISFDATDRDYYYQIALNLAVESAIQKAKSISANLGVQFDPIPIRIVENSTSPAPFQQFQRELASTPIMPGNIRIEAFVTAEFVY